MGMLPESRPVRQTPERHGNRREAPHLRRSHHQFNDGRRACRRSNLIDGKRRKRIARGSGTSVQEVNQVLKQYADMRRMMKQYGSYAKIKMRGLGKFAGLKPPPPGLLDEN